MGGQLLFGMLLILITVLIHAISLDYLIRSLLYLGPRFRARLPRQGGALFLSITVLGIFLAHVLEIWVWAFVFLLTEEVHSLETALYFSIVTFTTVGYGDITFSDQWRLLSSVESANGMLLFGWSTAFIFEVMRRTWDRDAREENTPAPSVS